MAFARVTIVVAAIFLLQPLSATSDFLSPLFSPIFDDVCKNVECGKGTCKASKNSTFFYECECEHGWKQSSFSSDDDDENKKNGFKFLPCIVPNCSMDYSCSKAPSPAQEKAKQNNESIFDACHWVDCGGGSCNSSTSLFSYSCVCDAGYYNLLNTTAFPCYRECDVGIGCSDLGISVKNSSAPPPSTLNDSTNNKASSILQGSSLWLVMLIMMMAAIEV